MSRAKLEKELAQQEEAEALVELKDAKTILQKSKDVKAQLRHAQGEAEAIKEASKDGDSIAAQDLANLEQRISMLSVSQAEIEKQAQAKQQARKRLLPRENYQLP